MRRVTTDTPNPQPMASKSPGESPETAFTAAGSWSDVISVTEGLDRIRTPRWLPPCISIDANAK